MFSEGCPPCWTKLAGLGWGGGGGNLPHGGFRASRRALSVEASFYVEGGDTWVLLPTYGFSSCRTLVVQCPPVARLRVIRDRRSGPADEMCLFHGTSVLNPRGPPSPAASPRARLVHGRTAVDYSAAFGRLDTLSCLIAFGCSISDNTITTLLSGDLAVGARALNHCLWNGITTARQAYGIGWGGRGGGTSGWTAPGRPR